MNGHDTIGSDHRFLAGLAMGSVVGAGLALWLAPRAAAEIKARATDRAKSVGAAVSGHYRDARMSMTQAMDGLTRRGQTMRDDACDSVISAAKDVEVGARHVQHFAGDAKSNVG